MHVSPGAPCSHPAPPPPHSPSPAPPDVSTRAEQLPEPRPCFPRRASRQVPSALSVLSVLGSSPTLSKTTVLREPLCVVLRAKRGRRLAMSSKMSTGGTCFPLDSQVGGFVFDLNRFLGGLGLLVPPRAALGTVVWGGPCPGRAHTHGAQAQSCLPCECRFRQQQKRKRFVSL